MKYNEILSKITEGTVITFREYTLDRRERKHLTLSIDNSLIERIIPANFPLSINELEEYYGEGLSQQDYLQLSCVNCVRIILFTEVKDGKRIYTPVFFNKDYYESGLQEIEIIGGEVAEEPLYAYSSVNRVPIIVKGDYNEEITRVSPY